MTVAPPLEIKFPPELPITARRAEIETALAAHQVIIVGGETGSGKTTQLPKMALAMGRGRMNASPGERGRLIGHTQPRRIAATSVARRIAEELHTPLGEVVGFQVRFQERVAPSASIKLMTDGILLAETQSDPLLQAYDTLIIDEAHERSLNIDFLLGYLKQILPRRADLKVIVTSATIDAERFAAHFADANGRPAPVLTVSGRTYPVEQRWRPFEESRDYRLDEAIADAVDELWRQPGGQGDILVFLPGEREIRDAAQHLRQHLARSPARQAAEVLPLFARLSVAEQERIFARHDNRRIVLATNVAETSLTVPGIRYVIDSGTARVKRYGLRSKVERLQVEPISQAAAQQRAGRCGRTAGGVCIRLYSEQDFAGRPRFTDPEILRSSLAGVVLRMKSLRLLESGSRVEDFPFLEAPSSRAITDGYQLLGELGAVDDAGELTAIGRELGRLPLDPRVGRMLLAGRDRGALHELLVIASALSGQDVRDRPLDSQAQADQQHAKFDDDKSEFMGLLRLWRWLDDARSGQAAGSRREMAAQGAVGDTAQRRPANLAVLPAAQRARWLRDADTGGAPRPSAGAAPDAEAARGKRLSNREYEQLLRRNFINLRRVREWRETYAQLRAVAVQHKWRLNAAPAGYDAIHKALLAGLLGNVGCRIEAEGGDPRGRRDYLGARGIKFRIHPGARLSRKPGCWIVCAELVETTQLFGRGVAHIEPRWLEEIGAHLLKKQVLDPHWEKKAGAVMALERATLYGLLVYHQRRVRYAPLDTAGAREIFIREALVAGDWPEEWARKLPFLAANRKRVAQVEALEQKARRQDLLVDDALIYAFYERQLPVEVCDGATLQKWYVGASRDRPDLLMLAREDLMRHEAGGITTAAFPKLVRLGGIDCQACYLHAPGDARDGLTVTVPLFALNQASAERAEWLVPGMLKEKIHLLLKNLPQKVRNRLVPLDETAARMNAELAAPQAFGEGDLLEALRQKLRATTHMEVRRSDFRPDALPLHLLMNFRLVGDHQRQLDMGRNLGALKAQWGTEARGAFQALAALKVAPAKPDVPADAAPRAETDASADHGATAAAVQAADARYVDWTFGELPELLEITRKGQTLVGFPALVDAGDAVTIEVFDEPEVAAARHRPGLRRLFALRVSQTLKRAQKDTPGWQKTSVAYLPLGTVDALQAQIDALALDHAFLADPLPVNAEQFRQRLEAGRPRLTLIHREVALLAGEILAAYAAAARKNRDTRGFPAVTQDVTEQLARLMPPRFLLLTPWDMLQHFPRYLKAVIVRLEKLHGGAARDAECMVQVRALDARYARVLAQRRGQPDDALQRLRWMLEELRVSFFAQALRTPRPVSVKRIEAMWSRVT